MRAIAIDGPAAAGKGTTAKRVASELGYTYCDTGALYRALAVGFLNRGLSDDSSVAEFEAVLPTLSVSLKTNEKGEMRVYLNDKDITEEIRSEEVSSLSSVTSAIPSVRAHLKQIQRSIAQERDVVMEGRDIGTVILPQADLKIFLTAEPVERAKRRYKDMIGKGGRVSFESVLKNMEKGDTRDSSRAVAPLKPAPDAIKVDNTKLTIEETVRQIVNLAKEKFGARENPTITQPNSISSFTQENFFLSNFFETEILYDGLVFRNSEAAFQAAKTLVIAQREKFTNLDGRQAKRLGRGVALRPDWEQIKDDVMLQILKAKFAPGTKLAKRLIDTGNCPLIEGNTWHDNYWGVCQCDRCKGREQLNHLGKLLEKVRAELMQTNEREKEQKALKYVVVFNYDFDPDCRAYPFEDEDSAKRFLRESFTEEVRVDVEENGYDIESYIQEDGWYARIINHFIERDDITEMRIAVICS